jgi:hypothetical protein
MLNATQFIEHIQGWLSFADLMAPHMVNPSTASGITSPTDMKCYVYIDFSLKSDGKFIGFSTGCISLDSCPVPGEFLKIDNIGKSCGKRVQTEFLVTRVAPADASIAGNEGLSWVVTCDDNFFSSRSEIDETVACLEELGLVFDGVDEKP